MEWNAAQDCPLLLLKGNFPAEFSTNTPAWQFLVRLNTLISFFRCVLLWLELNYADRKRSGLDMTKANQWFTTILEVLSDPSILGFGTSCNELMRVCLIRKSLEMYSLVVPTGKVLGNTSLSVSHSQVSSTTSQNVLINWYLNLIQLISFIQTWFNSSAC